MPPRTKDDLINLFVKHHVVNDPDECDIEDFEDMSTANSFNWASITKLTLVLKSSKTRIPVVIKPRPGDPSDNNWHINEMYINEVFIYKEVLPKFCPPNIIPKYYCGEANTDGNDFVILQDLKVDGFDMAKEFMLLPDDHVVMAVAKLGVLHGAFYAYKEQNPREIPGLMSRIFDTRFLDGLPEKDTLSMFALNIAQGSMQGVKEYAKRGGDPEIVRGLEERFMNNPMKFFLKLVEVEEPLAVLCHGDFNRNNLMFKYNQITDELESMVFIDFQTPRYASPAIDLSFFFMMNVSTEDRARNFDRYFSIYHNSLIKTLEERLPDYDREKYSLVNFLEDYGRHSLYGYTTVGFFWPLCHAVQNKKVDGNAEAVDFLDMTKEQYLEHFRKMYTEETDDHLYHCLKQLCDRFGKKILK